MSHSGKQIRQRKKRTLSILWETGITGNISLELKKDQFQEKLVRVVLGTLM